VSPGASTCFRFRAVVPILSRSCSGSRGRFSVAVIIRRYYHDGAAGVPCHRGGHRPEQQAAERSAAAGAHHHKRGLFGQPEQQLAGVTVLYDGGDVPGRVRLGNRPGGAATTASPRARNCSLNSANVAPPSKCKPAASGVLRAPNARAITSGRSSRAAYLRPWDTRSPPSGLYITSIAAGGPAARAGLQALEVHPNLAVMMASRPG
jgi:hypothetical protein